MMCTSKQFNELIKCKKIYCVVVALSFFAGGKTASEGRGVVGRFRGALPEAGWGWL